MKQVFTYMLAFAAFLFVGCQSSEKPNKRFTEASQPAVKETDERQEEQDRQDREMTDEEIREYGRVLAIEDGVYPMFIVTIEFPEREIAQDFNLNIEAIEMGVEELQTLNGRYVTLYYTSDLRNNLFELTADGKVIVDAKAIDPSWKNVSGVLEGADAETTSDLPGSVAVLSENGERIEFPCYITPEMVEVNGSEVTAAYSVSGIETITYLRAKEE